MQNSEAFYGYYYPVQTSGGAVFMAVVFLVLTLGHFWKVITTQNWFGLAIVSGGIFEFVGLSARACSHSTPTVRAPFDIQVVFIFLAPIFFAASMHLFLDRMILASRHKFLSLIKPIWFLPIFCVGDLLSSILQAVGVAHLVKARTRSAATVARYVMLSGLAIQIAFVCLLVLCLIVFSLRVNAPYLALSVDPNLRLNTNLRWLGACSLLIVVRNITRIVEFQGSLVSYFDSHEWTTYILDVILMMLFMVFTVSWYSCDSGSPRLRNSYPLMPRSRNL
ncbi:RTA1 like protein-domain-containing protein [Penicillium cosmopolitanum]|uniref:RTA1 like protein-domain-containing protein n=1 Tax=Penicillium cosmopolitanum TaxID=1131564 RepID=A0A9W9W7L9_9EURO|nr:RTA1 like protein-domain-containing protein [Penicillium cosmopolitanum]KAJ5407814.1 RTA1 like protein-domain-containing protein [Penicillium cosmopolitanum]